MSVFPSAVAVAFAVAFATVLTIAFRPLMAEG